MRAVARRLGVSTASVDRLVAQGDLPHARVSSAIRISPVDVHAYVAGCRDARLRRVEGGRRSQPESWVDRYPWAHPDVRHPAARGDLEGR